MRCSDILHILSAAAVAFFMHLECTECQVLICTHACEVKVVLPAKIQKEAEL